MFSLYLWVQMTEMNNCDFILPIQNLLYKTHTGHLLILMIIPVSLRSLRVNFIQKYVLFLSFVKHFKISSSLSNYCIVCKM